MHRFCYLAALAIFSTLGHVQNLWSAPPDAGKFAVTDATAADADFALQGEYLGLVAVGNGSEYAGLQVVALGDGKFDAVYLKGGLPAAGWDRRTKLKLKGTGAEGKLTLSGESTVIEVGADSAQIKDAQGSRLGSLPRIRRISPTLDATPPAGATVLFGGSPTEQFDKASLTPDGLLNGGTTTKLPVGDFRLHLEFRTPYMPYARGQGRGNSGLYIQQRYEVQILDSFGLEGEFNECGSLYRQRAPSVNTCLPPLAWQTYDIYFTAAKWNAEKKKSAAARITVLLNGEPVQDNVEISAKTGAGKAEGPEPFPINLQNHGNPVHFRNIWLVSGANAGLPPRNLVTLCQCIPDTYRRPRASCR